MGTPKPCDSLCLESSLLLRWFGDYHQPLHAGTNSHFYIVNVSRCFHDILYTDGIADSSSPMPVRVKTYGLLYCEIMLRVCMQAMETIVAQTRKVVRHNYESETEEVVTVKIWNPVIADITLLALGTSAPQISLAIIEAVQQLGEKTPSGPIL